MTPMSIARKWQLTGLLALTVLVPGSPAASQGVEPGQARQIPLSINSKDPAAVDPIWTHIAALEAGQGPEAMRRYLDDLPNSPATSFRGVSSDSPGCLPVRSHILGGVGIIGSFGETFRTYGRALVKGTILESSAGIIGRVALGSLLHVRVDLAAYPVPSTVHADLAQEQLQVRERLTEGSEFFLLYRAVPQFQYKGVAICADPGDMPEILAAGDEIIFLVDGAPLGDDASVDVYYPLFDGIVAKLRGRPPLIQSKWSGDNDLTAALADADGDDLSIAFREIMAAVGEEGRQ